MKCFCFSLFLLTFFSIPQGKVTESRDANLADKAGGINISLSVGNSKSQSTSTSQSDTAKASSITAKNNITLTATGDKENSDITIQGSQVSAGNNVTLNADHDIHLIAAKNTTEQHSDNQSSSGSIGIGFSLGGSQNGLSIQAGVSQGKGNGNGSEMIYSNTHINAGNVLTINSGNDTILQGAVAEANTVKAKIGGNLTIESLQDSATYSEKQKSVGASVSLCIPPFCVGAPSTGSLSLSKSHINSNYQNVTEQSAIKGLCSI